MHIIHPDEYTQATNLSDEVGTRLDLLQEVCSSQFVLFLVNGTVINTGGIVMNNGKALKDTITTTRHSIHQN